MQRLAITLMIKIDLGPFSCNKEAKCMIDIHCHILSGLDDGPDSVEGSLQIARKAIEDGATDIFATPHYNRSYTSNKEVIANKVKVFNQVLTENQMSLTIHTGHEVRIFGELLDGIKEGKIATLGDSNYCLLEFPPSTIPGYTRSLLYELQLKEIIPIIAHPERNARFIQKPELLVQMIQQGALSQLTAGSICGSFGEKIKHFSHLLMEANLAHFIASDAHGLSRNRPYCLKEAMHLVERTFGTGVVKQMELNAESVLAGNEIYPVEPLAIKKKKFFFF